MTRRTIDGTLRVKSLALATLLCATTAAAQTRINPTDPQPTCRMCPGTT